MPKGLDLVAAYRDHRARYFNYSGAGVLWERRDDSLDGLIDELLQAGTVVVEVIGPWTKPKPPEPKNGDARINLLTPSGIHLGNGPVEALNLGPDGRADSVGGIRVDEAAGGADEERAGIIPDPKNQIGAVQAVQSVPVESVLISCSYRF